MVNQHSFGPKGKVKVRFTLTEWGKQEEVQKAWRELADKYDFLVVVDETIGNFMNVEVLKYADIVVSSLTKIFSGAANCMGGRYGYFKILQSLLTRSQPDIESAGTPLRCPKRAHIVHL